MRDYELKHWALNQKVCGIDEVGRGCIAGPLVVCGLILPKDYDHPVINDSKAISEKKRNELFEEIVNVATSIEIIIINEKTIDEENIYQATKNAMEQIINLNTADHYLVDAMKVDTDASVDSIIKGDTLCISIAAASIVAKVVRDQIMLNLDEVYPNYGFKNHKGYPTKMHKEMLDEYGVLDFHRRSYKPVIEVINRDK